MNTPDAIGILIPVSATDWNHLEQVVLANNFRQIAKAIASEYITIAQCVNADFVMYCDEEGLLNRKAKNNLASQLSTSTSIVGDVWICFATEEGDIKSVISEDRPLNYWTDHDGAMLLAEAHKQNE